MKSDLQKIPGIGEKTERMLCSIGYPTIASLRGEDPEAIYRKDCEARGTLTDRCMLYVYRCAVYYAESENPDIELLKWWNHSDEKIKNNI